MKKGASAAKGKTQRKQREQARTLSKSARAERKAERKVAELRAFLVKAEKKLAKHAARAAALVIGVISKPETSVESPPVPVAIESSATKAEVTPVSTPYKGERETPPSAPAAKRPAARSIKSSTAPVRSAKRAAPNHMARKGNQIETPAPTEKEGGNE